MKKSIKIIGILVIVATFCFQASLVTSDKGINIALNQTLQKAIAQCSATAESGSVCCSCDDLSSDCCEFNIDGVTYSCIGVLYCEY